jgi:hypothetical protein
MSRSVLYGAYGQPASRALIRIKFCWRIFNINVICLDLYRVMMENPYPTRTDRLLNARLGRRASGDGTGLHATGRQPIADRSTAPLIECQSGELIGT